MTNAAPLTHADGSPTRALVVDDEPTLAELLADGAALRGLGGAHRGAPARRRSGPPATSGPTSCSSTSCCPTSTASRCCAGCAATTPTCPVLFLTARDAVEDRIAGLTAGGDDYVTKPFSLEEVVARLRGLLRRSRRWPLRADDALLVVGDLTLDEDSHEVRRGDDLVELTATEFELLRYLMRNPKRVLSQGADPRPGVELRLRRPGQRRRALHLLPAQEDRRRPRPDDPHRARRRVRAQAGRVRE